MVWSRCSVTDVEPAPNAEESTGRTLIIGGRYQVRRALGAGGMGVVYEARHNWTGRRVAVKVLSSERVKERGFDERFAREARAAARVRHPNVVDVLDSGFDPDAGGFFIVQELLEGEDLRARLIRDGRLSPDTAVELMIAVAEGLAAVHSHQIVHRDVKPGNIFLSRADDGTTSPKVIDFGVSKVLDEPCDADTSTGRLLGTPRYMAPEQLRGERDIDARADVWSAGAVLYELLAGRAPFDAPNHNLLVFEVLSGAPVAPIADVPASLMAIVLRALERDRSKRFESMCELRDALIAWRAAGSIAPPARPSRRVAVLALASLASLVALVTLSVSHCRVEPARRPAPTLLAERVEPRAESPSTQTVAAPPSGPTIVAPAPPHVDAPTHATLSPRRPLPPRTARPRPALAAAPSSAPREAPSQTQPAASPVAPSPRALILQPSSNYPRDEAR